MNEKRKEGKTKNVLKRKKKTRCLFMLKFDDVELQSLYENLLQDEYIDVDGSPLKCPHCESQAIGKGRIYYEMGLDIEYEEICLACQQRVGYWSYGSREPFWDYYDLDEKKAI